MRKNSRTIAVLLIACMVVSMLPATCFAVEGNTIQVSDEASLRAAVENGGTIELTNSITLVPTASEPWIINQDTTINGNGHSLTLRTGGIL